MTTTISQLWDLTETWGFREELKAIVLHHPYDDNNKKEDEENMEDKDKEEEEDNNNFSALRLDRDLGFLRGPQDHSFPTPHPDDNNNNNEEDIGIKWDTTGVVLYGLSSSDYTVQTCTRIVGVC